MFSCLNIVISSLVSLLHVSVERYLPPMHIKIWDSTTPLKVTVSHVCSVGLDENKREVFLVKEGVFLLSDGKTFKVLKQDGI